MCDPATLAAVTAALGATEAVSSYVGGRQAAAANEQAANYNYARERDAIGRQDVQLQQENSEQAFDTALAAASARGTIAASASESGLAPSSLLQQVNADMFGLARGRSAELTNLANQRNQLAEGKTDAAIKRDTQIASMPKPTVASLVIGLGKAGLQAGNTYRSASKAGS